MPSIVDALKELGFDVDDAKAELLKAKLEEADEVKGLKQQRDSLLEEKKTSAQKAKEAEEARKAAEEAAIQNSNDIASLKEFFAGKEKALQDQIRQRDQRILGGVKESVLAEVAGKFISPAAAKLMLGGLVDVGYGDGGEPTVTFRGADGKPLQGGKEDFIKYLYGSADFQPLLTGVQSSGGGAAGGVGHGGAVDLSKMTMTERAQLANTNPALFEQLSKR